MREISRLNKIRIIFLGIGGLFLFISYLCFIYVIKIPAFDSCGSACEYWWTWMIDIPPQGICIAICVPRNVLYKPLFLIGCVLITIEVVNEVFRIIERERKK